MTVSVPAVLSATVGTDGTTLTVVFDDVWTGTTTTAFRIDISERPAELLYGAYVSGDTTDTWVLTLKRVSVPAQVMPLYTGENASLDINIVDANTLLFRQVIVDGEIIVNNSALEPAISSAVISANGRTLTVTYDTAVTPPIGETLSVNNAFNTLTPLSTAANTVHVYSIAPAVLASDDTITFDTVLPSASDYTSVTNNSTATLNASGAPVVRSAVIAADGVTVTVTFDRVTYRRNWQQSMLNQPVPDASSLHLGGYVTADGVVIERGIYRQNVIIAAPPTGAWPMDYNSGNGTYQIVFTARHPIYRGQTGPGVTLTYSGPNQPDLPNIVSSPGAGSVVMEPFREIPCINNSELDRVDLLPLRAYINDVGQVLVLEWSQNMWPAPYIADEPIWAPNDPRHRPFTIGPDTTITFDDDQDDTVVYFLRAAQLPALAGYRRQLYALNRVVESNEEIYISYDGQYDDIRTADQLPVKSFTHFPVHNYSEVNPTVPTYFAPGGISSSWKLFPLGLINGTCTECAAFFNVERILTWDATNNDWRLEVTGTLCGNTDTVTYVLSWTEGAYVLTLTSEDLGRLCYFTMRANADPVRPFVPYFNPRGQNTLWITQAVAPSGICGAWRNAQIIPWNV